MKKSLAGPLVEGLALGAMSVLGRDLVDRAATGVQLVLRVHQLPGTRPDALLVWVGGRGALHPAKLRS